ncbi:MAG: hypothetical protein WC975_15920 [Phycisphaerae bacterium]
MIQPRIDLPIGPNPPALAFPHFPTRQQAIVWRNWQLVPVERLAKVLRTDAPTILKLAGDLGLPLPPVVSPSWLTRGYITLIRNNWHLLPYAQLLELVDWTVEQMDNSLREEDFLWGRLGSLKPQCEGVYYSPLSPDQIRRTLEIRQTMEKHFPDHDTSHDEPPFAFVESFQKTRPNRPISKKSNRFDLRLIYPYFAVYGDPLLNPQIDPFPDGLLERLAEEGINGVWMQGLLYTLVRWDPAPEMSAGCDTRIKNLRALARRAEKYGIGLYLYFNEPRALPLRFFDRYPEWKGVELEEFGLATLCTSHPPVLDLLRRNTETLFREAPELAGVFTITMSENPTHCHSRWTGHQCPRCAPRPVPEVVAQVNCTIEQGVHAAKPGARVIVWAWGWDLKWASRAIDLLPDNVELMCTSEEALPTHIGGIPANILDYSISQVGPGDHARQLWGYASKRGLKTMAKVQMNNTWECFTVPYIPAVDLVEKHLNNLNDLGINGLMVSWTLGGYPGGNLDLLSTSSETLALEKFGPRAAPVIRQAWNLFSRAFPEFPFYCSIEHPALYFGPQSHGPANLLYATPTAYSATVATYPYDDLTRWRGIYHEEIYENQFRKLSETWKQGLEQLGLALPMIDAEHRQAFDDLNRVAWAVYCHFRSSFLQTAFIRLRDSETSDKASKMFPILEEEIDLAKTLYQLARQDSRLGFESSSHYAYTLNDLREKVINCEYLRLFFAPKK